MRRLAHVGGAVLAVFAVFVVLGPAPGHATAEKVATRVDLRMEYPIKREFPALVVGTVTTTAGSAVNGVAVRVYINVSAFGGRSALLGSALTDASGEARIPVRPDRVSYEMRATFAGNENLAPSEIVKTIGIPPEELRPSLEPAGSALLESVRDTAPKLIAASVALAWALLTGGLVWVLRRIHHHGTRLPVGVAER